MCCPGQLYVGYVSGLTASVFIVLIISSLFGISIFLYWELTVCPG